MHEHSRVCMATLMATPTNHSEMGDRMTISEAVIDEAAKAIYMRHNGIDWEAETDEVRGMFQRDAQAAIESAAPQMVIHVHHHDIEHHARSFNEGFDAAVAQGLADDPSLAGDWLDTRMAEAYDYGWREGKGIPTPVAVGSHDLLHAEAKKADWNPYRGEEVARG